MTCVGCLACSSLMTAGSLGMPRLGCQAALTQPAAQQLLHHQSAPRWSGARAGRQAPVSVSHHSGRQLSSQTAAPYAQLGCCAKADCCWACCAELAHHLVCCHCCHQAHGQHLPRLHLLSGLVLAPTPTSRPRQGRSRSQETGSAHSWQCCRCCCCCRRLWLPAAAPGLLTALACWALRG